MLQVGRRLYGPKGRQQQGVLASVAGWTFNGPERQSGEKYGHVELSNIIGVPSLSLRATRHRRHHHFIIIIIGFIRAAHVQQLSLETGASGGMYTHIFIAQISGRTKRQFVMSHGFARDSPTERYNSRERYLNCG